ncbi:hypothetical protein Taro_022908 [Colocasia esculenta]|uniref:alpha-L-fucosidase n=1 Tax=Colocasia esculenta TaxID=4460 RepID=A0A843V2U9_COLES|nr:hypothetical protein [Colocasia esculenta]
MGQAVVAGTRGPPSLPVFLLPILLFLTSLASISIAEHVRSSSSSSSSYSAHVVQRERRPPPLPILPLPSASQLSWQLSEMAMFLHFGPNTFTDSEWGTGHADPAVFNPEALDARQWARAAAEAGFSRVVITAKHHDGFCLWPSAYTDYSVRSSPWRGGRGDVVGELAAAAREVGIGMGIYLSPWDRHEASYGKTTEYNEYYLGQMRELLTGYGEIKEVFLDGAKGENATDMNYLFDCWFRFIHQLQPQAVIFSDAGPDSRWIGNEAGVAGRTCWSLFNQSAATIGSYLENASLIFCSILRAIGVQVMEIKVGLIGFQQNAMCPSDQDGLISDEDLQVLQDFSTLRRIIFSVNFADEAIITASSTRGGISDLSFSVAHLLKEGIQTYWAPEEGQCSWGIHLDLQKPVQFNVLLVQEPIQMGQRIFDFHIDAIVEGEWQTVTYGTTIGYKRLLKFPMVTSQYLRLVINESRADPLISYLGIYLDPFLSSHGAFDACTSTSSDSNRFLQLLSCKSNMDRAAL